MSDFTASGPIDFILLEFPADSDLSGVVTEVQRLVDSDTIRLYDVLLVSKDADGAVSALEFSDLSSDEGLAAFAVFAGAVSGLLGDEDLQEAGSALEPGTTAALLVFENHWAAPFVGAAFQAGGAVAATARIPAADVIAALDALDAAEA